MDPSWCRSRMSNFGKQLDELMQTHQVLYEHVKGHAGHVENERCDMLAVAAYQKYLEKS